jgi:hypothetical protein
VANQVAITSFVYRDPATGLDHFYRQDVTTVPATDVGYVAVPQMFMLAGGAKTANSSFCYRDAAGVDRLARKNKTKVAITHAAWLAAPGLFT